MIIIKRCIKNQKNPEKIALSKLKTNFIIIIIDKKLIKIKLQKY